MLIDISGALSCVPLAGFALFPLPATKSLWEARNTTAWRTEFDVTLREKELFGISTEGQLTSLRFEYGGMRKTTADWGKWYAEMDSFGTLTMIASSLL